MFKKIASLSFLASFALLASPTAHADSFYFTNGSSIGVSAPASTLCGGTNCFGVVDLTQAGSNVDVSVTLTPGIYFVSTGNTHSHETFAFDGTFSAAQISTPSGWTLGTNGNEAGLGTFNFYQECTTACPGGNGTSTLSSLSFTVTGATISQFGTAFGADVLDTLVSGNPATGNIGADGSVPATPEPSSLIMLGTGIVGAAGMLRRRFAA